MNAVDKISGNGSCPSTRAQATRSKNTKRKAQNSFFNFIPGKEIKNRSQVTREHGTHFHPKESKGSQHLINLDDFSDLLPKITEVIKKLFGDKWLNKVTADKTGEEYIKRVDALIECGLTRKEAEAIIDYANQNANRAIQWAHDNEKYGGYASTSMSFALVLGPLRHVLSGLEFVPAFVKKVINFAYACSLSLRGAVQYSKYVYNRPDDEASMNRYQALMYGNVIAGKFGSTACFMESKVNPFLLPASSLLIDSGNPTSFDKLLALATIPNISWWRSRMPAHINQRFLTDLCNFLFHKPLALLGRAKSIEIIDDIKQSKVLNWGYFVQRHYENIGLKDKKIQTFSNFVGKLFNSVKDSFSSKDTSKQIESAKKAGKTIAPTFGTLAFSSSTIGIPLKLFCGGLGIKNTFLDLFSSFSLSAQQSIYLFKMVIPEINGAKKIKLLLSDKKFICKTRQEGKENQINDLFKLHNKKTLLSYLGIFTFSMSILNSFLKLFGKDSVILEKTKKITENLACDLVAMFFSFRRHTLGFQFRAENPEFYEGEEKEGNKMANTNESRNGKVNEPFSNNGGLEGQNGKPPFIKALKPLGK